MTSGVPQGTILGPTLFLLYVNDIPNVVTSSIKMFADDTKIYREINNAEDTLALQSDLDCLENWTRSWQVKFNPQKCEAMRITHKQDKSKHPYHLSNTELKSVNSCKDLGVHVSRDLSWSNHVNATVIIFLKFSQGTFYRDNLVVRLFKYVSCILFMCIYVFE